MGDFVLGLLPPPAAAELEALAARRPGCAALVRTLRRGRRRLEGLPATPDMGNRVLLSVLAAAPVRAQPAASPAPAPAARPVPAPATAPATGELAPTGEMHIPDPRPAPQPAPALASHPGWEEAPAMTGGGGSAASPQHDQRVSSATATRVASPAEAQARVIDLRDQLADEEDTAGMRPAGRRRDPYAALADLDEVSDGMPLPDPHRMAPRTRQIAEPDDEPDDLDAFYPEEELITRPSMGQRLLVLVGYVLPIVLGAGLGLFIADLLFPR
jgi:hypothetical protein